MNRRDVIAGVGAGFALLASGAQAQSDPLEAAFAALPQAARKQAQQEMAFAGFYNSAIDGAYGRGTATGLRKTAEFVAYSSDGKVTPQTGTAAGAQAFVRDLASGRLAKWLYGEGDENDM